jgi:spermidine/putrescine-binding protein
MWGTTGIGINVDMVKERLGDDADLNTWDLVFDKETWPSSPIAASSCSMRRPKPSRRR